MASIIDHLKKVLSSHGVADPKNIAAKIAETACTSAALRSQDMADEAAIALMSMGVASASISPCKAMALGARLQLEKLFMMGVLSRSRFKAPHGKQVKAVIRAGGYAPLTPDDLRDLAFFLDVCLFVEQHFSPLRNMMTEAVETGGLGDSPEQTYLTSEPFSEEARTCVASLDKVNFTKLKSRPMVFEPKTMDELLQEKRLTEPEAARVLRKAPKTLADQRRNRLLPKTLYVQDAPDGTVYYPTQTLVSYASGSKTKT